MYAQIGCELDRGLYKEFMYVTFGTQNIYTHTCMHSIEKALLDIKRAELCKCYIKIH